MSDSPRNTAPFSLIEEEFFRAGAIRSEVAAPVESFTDLDEGYRPTPLWRRLFSRKATHS